MNGEFLKNQKLTKAQLRALDELTSEDDRVLFVVSGNLSVVSRYCDTMLIVTPTRLISCSQDKEGVTHEEVRLEDVAKISNKRMYGNGMMRIEKKDGTRLDFFRFTFSVAVLCDAAVTYVQRYIAGEDMEEAIKGVEATFQKQLSICPNCGRTLSAPGVQCVSCMKKGDLVRKLAKYLKPEIVTIIISMLICFVTTALALTPPILTRALVDDILPNRNRDMLLIVSLLLVAINIVRYILAGVRTHTLRVLSDRVIARIKCDVYEKAQFLPMRFYDRTSTGSVINRINGDVANLNAFMLKITQEVIVQFFKLVGIIVIMLFMNWKLTLLSLCPVPIVVIGSRIFRKKIAPFYRRIWRRSSAVTSVLTDTIPGIRVTKSFTNEKNATNRFSKCVDEWKYVDSKASKIINAYPAIVNCFIACGTVLIWSFGGNLVIDGLLNPAAENISVGLLVSFISYATMFYDPVNFFANFSDSTQNALASAERLLDILDAEPEQDFGRGNTSADMGGRIEFRNVNFSFDRTKKVLKNINLTIEPGDIVGIVGTTGSGKTTLINLLLRYYDHYDGTILIDGVDIRNIDMTYYRSSIGYVQQEPMMFHDTIYNNISYGDGSFSVDQIVNAADIANAHEFIIRQPDGYDSVLGERGTGLSGGEKQRISIARAMLRDPKMLVFDEATASVDSETEHLIQDAIEHLISGRTTIMIAHRLSTLSKANKIVVVDNGSIIECGTPEELLAQKGKYYKLVQIQSMSEKAAKEREEERFGE